MALIKCWLLLFTLFSYSESIRLKGLELFYDSLESISRIDLYFYTKILKKKTVLTIFFYLKSYSVYQTQLNNS